MTSQSWYIEVDGRRVEVVRKDKSWLMRAIGFFLGAWFMERAWTTISPWRIYYPTTLDSFWVGRSPAEGLVIEHESVHIRQARRWPVLWQLSYLLAPVPVLLAWFRWRWEREAYLVQLYASAATPAELAETLWRRYAWPWPKAWMVRWFDERAKEEAIRRIESAWRAA